MTLRNIARHVSYVSLVTHGIAARRTQSCHFEFVHTIRLEDHHPVLANGKFEVKDIGHITACCNLDLPNITMR